MPKPVGLTKIFNLAKPCYNPTLRDGEEPYQGIIEVEVCYSLGGANYFQGTQEKRGYWLHVSPSDIRTERGFTSKAFTIGSGPKGSKAFLLEVKRRTAKSDAEALRLGALLERSLLDRVLSQGLELAPGQTLPEAPAALPERPRGTISA